MLPRTQAKDIPGYEGFYSITLEGKVWSQRKSMFLTPMVCGRSRYRYPAVNLKGKQWKVSHLMLLTYVGSPEKGQQACHNDGNQFNNCLDNLRWDSPSSNCKDTLRHGNHKTAKITYELAEEIRQYRAQYNATYSELSRRYGLDQSNIGRIIRNEIWN